jgi:hypothetical protein
MRKHFILGDASTSGPQLLDAAKVPPSVFVEHQGEPQITHGDYTHDRAGRNTEPSDQEKLSGV